MDLVGYVDSVGGASSWSKLVGRWGRSAVERAISAGVIERAGRGRYVLSSAAGSLKTAVRAGGVVSMRSAAQLHGWAQKRVPERPDITFRRTRHVTPQERTVLCPHWSDLRIDDVERGVTSVRRTLVDCMRMLPLDESLPIVESALRVGDVTPGGLRAIADSMRGRGRARARAVARLASTRTANAYESVLHALASTIPGLRVKPQLPVRVAGRVLHPDLVDPELGIVIEAESFAWHGDTTALTRDCERYNALVASGWLVVRFSWSQVMFRPAYVLDVLERAVRVARRHANVA